MQKVLFFFIIFLAGIVVFPRDLFAQITSSSVALPIAIQNENVTEGDVICSGREGYKLCDEAYNSALYGVVTDNPAASFEQATDSAERLAVTTGKANVKVTSINGNIAVGDLVTSSREIPGTGQKATRNGYVLGLAVEPYESADPTAVGTIVVSLNVHPTTVFTDVSSNLWAALREGLAAPVLTPLAALRYLLAALVILAAFILGFIHFGRLSKAGIEAIGRNPLARLQIQATLFLNILLVIGILIIGVVLAYLILIL